MLDSSFIQISLLFFCCYTILAYKKLQQCEELLLENSVDWVPSVTLAVKNRVCLRKLDQL